MWGLILLLLSIDAAPPLASGPWGSRKPVARSAAVVQQGHARFTVLTDRLLRLEYSAQEGGPFEDRATMFAINRNMGEVPSFT